MAGGSGSAWPSLLNTNVAGGGGGSSLASSSYLTGASVAVTAGTGGIQLAGSTAGPGAAGSVALTFNGVAGLDAPTGVSAIPGNHQAVVSFTAPLSDNGSPVTGYTVASSPGGITVTCSASPCTITGLTNGTAYTFTVHASNTNGDSVESSASSPVTPAVSPEAPTGVSAARGNHQAVVTFTASASNGGSAVTGYTVTSSPGGVTATCVASPCTITGLINGTAYTFTVHATNGIGDSPESSASTALTPTDVPGAPSAVSANGGNRQAMVSFTSPASGGSSITGYQYSHTPSAPGWRTSPPSRGAHTASFATRRRSTAPTTGPSPSPTVGCAATNWRRVRQSRSSACSGSTRPCSPQRDGTRCACSRAA